MKANYHTHTTRCGHAYGTDESFVRAAIQGGFETLAFTDHSPWPYKSGFTNPNVRMNIRQLDGYLEANGIQITDIKIERSENGSTTYELELRIGREMTISDVTGFLEAMDGVQKISFEMEG